MSRVKAAHKITFWVCTMPSDTIGVVKERIMHQHGFPFNEQQLVFGGVWLSDITPQRRPL
jgi:hypothetical protein